MRYTTELIKRQVDDENGQLLSDMISAELTYMSDRGMSDFMLVPVQNAGRTVSVIIAGRGEAVDSEAGLEIFREVTGLNHPDELDLGNSN